MLEKGRLGLKAGVLAEPILVGREHELADLHQYLDAALAGKGATVFVSGEAGSGKTRLTFEFLKSARELEVTVLSGWCLSNAAVPYFPFVEAFESFLAQNEADRPINSQQLGLKTWLMGPNQAEGISPQAWKDQKFAAITKELLFISTEKPLILFIDDLHWADSASLALLHYIARVISSERILVLATFRSEELSPTTEGFVHPLLDTLRLMGREDLFKEVKLLNLTPSDVGRISENMLGGKVHAELVQKLAEESRGNPLFVIESLRMLFENGSLTQAAGQWQLGIDKLSIPIKVKDIILRRLSVLKPNQRRTLDVASIVGDKFDPKLLGAVLNEDSLEVLETLNSIALSKSLVCVEGDYYWFDHAKTREVLYDEILLPLKKGYHERVAERIESLNKNLKQLPVSDLAYHYTQAGNKAKSIEYNLAAGKDSLARFSNTEAIKNFTYVLDAILESPEFSDEKIIAMEGRADALFASGLFNDAMKAFEQLSEMVETGVVKLRALRKAMLSSYWHGDSEHSLEIASKAEQYSEFDSLENARLHLYNGFVAGRAGKSKEAIKSMEWSLKIFENGNSIPDIASALVELCFVYPSVGRVEDCLAAALRSVELYEELGDSQQLGFALGRLGSALMQCGYFKEALKNYSKAIKINEKVGDYNKIALNFLMSGIAFEYLGDNKAAVNESLKGLACAQKTDSHYAKSICYSNLIREYARLGEIQQAEEFGKRLDKLFDEVASLKSSKVAMDYFWYSKALILALRKQWEEANKIFEKCLEYLGNSPRSASEIGLRMDFSFVLLKQGKVEEAKIQTEIISDILRELEKKFRKTNIQTYVTVTKEISAEEKLNLRVDIVNLSKNLVKLVRVEALVPMEFKISALPLQSSIENGCLNLNESKLDSFTVKPLKLVLQPTKGGIFALNPQLICIDNAGKNQICKLEPFTITVKPASFESKTEMTALSTPAKVEFKSEAAAKVFDFLLRSFVEDNMRQKLSTERSGWRTLMDAVKKGHVSKYSVYGSSGNHGLAISELVRSGLVEARLFIGERGRGGKIFKVRVAYEKETVKLLINERKKN